MRSEIAHGDLEDLPPPREVSGRFLADFFRILEKQGISVASLLGDLPIAVANDAKAVGPVDWSDFVEVMKRLENEVGGDPGLAALGARIGEAKPAAALRALVGLSGSARVLYMASIRWALPRALPMLQTTCEPGFGNRVTISVEIPEALRPCPALFHLATGAVRALPRILELPDAVVDAHIENRRACYQVVLPPSKNLFAQCRRVLRTLFSAGSVLQFLEQQQLELHAQHAALQKAHDALARSDAQHRALTDATVDALLEVDDAGKIVHASASIEQIIGYRSEQVTGSHFSLWMPRSVQSIARARFRELSEQPPGSARFREIVPLLGTDRSRVIGELSVRSYLTHAGELRFACVLRDLSTRTDPPHASTPLDPDEPVGQFPHDSMARIVHVAMAQSERGESGTTLTETRKLLDALRIDVGQDADLEGVELRIDATRCPDEFEAEAPLLRIALGSLIAFVHQSAPRVPLIDLDVLLLRNPLAGRTTERVIDFRLEARAKSEWDLVDRGSRERFFDASSAETSEKAALAMAIARDAANALSGTILVEDPLSPRIRLRVPIR